MNRDNVLYLVIGLLTGFISGYLMHEVMAARQPQRLVANQVGAVGAAVPNSVPPSSNPPGQAGGPPMAEISRLREQVEAHPDDADAVLLLANLNYDIKNWQRAGELYQQYLDLRPDSPDVLTDLGVTLRERGQFQEALSVFRQAQDLSADHWQSVYNEVVVHAFDLQDFDAANEALERLRVLQPSNPEIDRLAQEVARRAGTAT